MLSYKIIMKNGDEVKLDKVLTATLDSDLSVPADSLSLTCPFDGGIRANAAGIKAFSDGGLVFAGALDNLSSVKNNSGVILKLNARSLAAALLDNEAEPLVYNNPTASMIETKHLLPFGITLAEGDGVPYYDKLKIDKGMSHWQVVKQFCQCRYGAEPRISGDGKAYLNGLPTKGGLVFSDLNEGVKYFSLKESNRMHKLISEVRVKFKQTNTYKSYIKNGNPDAVRMNRVRYINAAANHTTLSTAYKILENSNRDSYELKLECMGCYTEILGKSACVDDSVLGKLSGMRVEKVKYTLDSRGERSEITLKKENYDVADELYN